jgi:hypothetical protein
MKHLNFNNYVDFVKKHRSLFDTLDLKLLSLKQDISNTSKVDFNNKVIFFKDFYNSCPDSYFVVFTKLIRSFNSIINDDNNNSIYFIMNYIYFSYDVYSKLEKYSFNDYFIEIYNNLTFNHEKRYTGIFGIPSQSINDSYNIASIDRSAWVLLLEPHLIISSLNSNNPKFKKIASFILLNEDSFPTVFFLKLNTSVSNLVEFNKITDLFTFKILISNLSDDFSFKQFKSIYKNISSKRKNEDPNYFIFLFFSAFVKKYGFDVLKDEKGFLSSFKAVFFKKNNDKIPDIIKKEIFTPDFDKLIILCLYINLGV